MPPSDRQQQMMEMALAVKKGKKELTEVPLDIRATVERFSDTMSERDLSDYASKPRKISPRFEQRGRPAFNYMNKGK